MKFGLALQNYVAPGESISFGELLKIATEAERLGFASIWVWDHVFLGSKNIFPVYDSLTVLTAVATVTHRVRLATGVLALPLRNPVELAKRVSTIDNLSEGRMTLGVASGWYEREFQACGVPFAKRGKDVETGIEMMRRLWTEDRLSGIYGKYNFRNVTMEPKPVQKPCPPIWMGGYTEIVHARIAKFADGWISYFYTPDSFRRGWERILQYSKFAGRKFGTGRFGNCNIVPARLGKNRDDSLDVVRRFVSKYCDLPAWSEATSDSAIVGSDEDCRETVREYVGAGVEEIVLMPAVMDLLEICDQVAKLGKHLVGTWD